MRFGLAVLVGLGFAVPLAAQQGSIRVRVVGNEGQPLQAAVAIASLRLNTTTDAGGRVLLERIPAGPHEVRITAVGWEAVTRRVVVAPSAEVMLLVALRPVAQAMGEVVVVGQAPPGTVRAGADRTGALATAGAKTEVIAVAGSPANLAEKTGRQVFARVPGVFVYDMDGSGNQINVSTRGLDPHRSWELNVRQDGVIVNSDLYGYPASHYSLPLEAVDRVESVRGTAALQYGAQFGGFLNYVTRAPDTLRAASGQLLAGAGSFGLANVFGSAGGRVGRVTWQAYGASRGSDGYRANSRSEYNAQFAAVTLPLGRSLVLRSQVGRSYYRYQIPGPLTDSMFHANPTASTRARNWFSPDITVPAVRLEWRPTPRTEVRAQVSGVFGARNSVQFLGFATVPDGLDFSGQYAPRVVDVDIFRSVSAEVRLVQVHRAFGVPGTLVAGIDLSDNDLHRRQQGRGSRGVGYDLAVTGAFGRDLHYKTRNVAVHVENTFRVTPSWDVVPGFRLEHGTTRMTGRLAYYDPAGVPNEMQHDFPLFGLRSEYRLGAGAELYGGFSQAYRPMVLKDVLPENILERTDHNLKDARGWTVEAGVRGRLGAGISYDISGFALRYDNRFGTVLETDGTSTYLFKTNVGSSLTRGVEVALDVPVLTTSAMHISAFTATSFYHASYRQGSVVSGGVNRSIAGNRVETVPRWISRNGLSVTAARVSGGITVSHTSGSFADPLNTREPSPNGAVGWVPGYTLVDLSVAARVTGWLGVRAGLDNALNRHYFTKRPSFYPGPGVWPSDGRGFHLSLDLHP